MKAKLLIFDLDGTLINSLQDLTTALNLTMNDLKLPTMDAEAVRKHVGPGVRKLLRSAEAQKIFEHHYLNHLVKDTHFYPGMREILEQLHGVEVILTNKMNIYLGPLLNSMGIRNYFSAVYGLESFPTYKPDPGPLYEISRIHSVRCEEMLMIGDTESDIRAGKTAGVPTCAVNWGYGEERVLRLLTPDFQVSHPEELKIICCS